MRAAVWCRHAPPERDTAKTRQRHASTEPGKRGLRGPGASFKFRRYGSRSKSGFRVSGATVGFRCEFQVCRRRIQVSAASCKFHIHWLSFICFCGLFPGTPLVRSFAPAHTPIVRRLNSKKFPSCVFLRAQRPRACLQTRWLSLWVCVVLRTIDCACRASTTSFFTSQTHRQDFYIHRCVGSQTQKTPFASMSTISSRPQLFDFLSKRCQSDFGFFSSTSISRSCAGASVERLRVHTGMDPRPKTIWL